MNEPIEVSLTQDSVTQDSTEDRDLTFFGLKPGVYTFDIEDSSFECQSAPMTEDEAQEYEDATNYLVELERQFDERLRLMALKCFDFRTAFPEAANDEVYEK